LLARWNKDRKTGSRAQFADFRRLRRHLLSLGHLCLGGILAQLQCTDIGHDGPAILGRNLRSIVGHRAKAVSHDVEEISQWCFSKAINMVRRRMTVTALWDHSVAIANPRVTWRAINVEAFASAGEHLIVDRKWHVVARRVADLAGIKIRVGAQIA